VNIETVLGVILIYNFLQHVFSVHLQQDQRHVDMLTADLLAFYMANLHNDYCACLVCKSQREMYNNYKTSLLKRRELEIADVLLFHEIHCKTSLNGQNKVLLYSISHDCKRRIIKLQSLKFNTTGLSRLLVQCAVEHLTAFRVSESRDFSSARNIATNDVQAMYVYKCHLYDECIHLCEENINRLLYVDGGTITVVFRVTELHCYICWTMNVCR
jgi:hypothetical protein